MAYKHKLKRVGRPKVVYKVRNVNPIAPKGFKFLKYSNKKKSLIYKKV